jgi:hypothetical protein
MRCRETKPHRAPPFLSPLKRPEVTPGRGETRTRGAHRAVGHEVSSGVEGTSGAADQRNFRERRWKAALTARRIFGSGGSGVTIRSQHDLRVARHPKWGERGRTTSKPKRELRFHRGASLGSSARSCFAALIQTARHVGTRHGVLRSRQVGENPRRRADADAGVARPLVGSATPELQSLVGGGPKGLPISLRAAVRRRDTNGEVWKIVVVLAIPENCRSRWAARGP